jgi:hypothetical protein
MFAPHTIYKEYGLTLDDINLDEYYDELVANPNIANIWKSFPSFAKSKNLDGTIKPVEIVDKRKSSSMQIN